MALRMAPPAPLAVAAALLTSSCVQNYSAAAYPPAPQMPPSSAVYVETTGPQPVAQEGAPAGIPSGVLDRLLGPIALYPDPLLALILAASTAPADVSAASAYLVQYGDMTRIDSQPWDPSVRALAHYPAVLSWMAENMEWTRALGSAFLASPAAVMQSVQRLRERAVAAGALRSTPQQQVVVQDNEIEILPAEPDWIYAPAYDPDVVYSDEPYDGYGGPFMNFGEAYPVGPWLSYCPDWGDGCVWIGGWGAWHGRGGWHHPRFDREHAPPGAHRWKLPAPGPGSAPPVRGWHGDSVPLPHPSISAPTAPPSHSKHPAAPPGVQASAVPAPRTPTGAPVSAVTVPTMHAPPVDRPRLERPAEPVQGGSQAAASAPRTPPAEGAQRVPRFVEAPERPPPPRGPEPAGPATRSELPRAAEPAPSHASAPAPSRDSAPASSRESAPAADPKNH